MVVKILLERNPNLQQTTLHDTVLPMAFNSRPKVKFSVADKGEESEPGEVDFTFGKEEEEKAEKSPGKKFDRIWLLFWPQIWADFGAPFNREFYIVVWANFWADSRNFMANGISCLILGPKTQNFQCIKCPDDIRIA